jgi:CheY-like chemotaxis protein
LVVRFLGVSVNFLSLLYGSTTQGRAEPVQLSIIDDNPVGRGNAHGSPGACGLSDLQGLRGPDQQGQKRALAQHPDLIVVDLLMPEVRGFEVVQRLQAHPQTQEIPVFVMTTKDSLSEETRELNSLVAAVIRKDAFAREAFLKDIGTRLRRMAAQERRAQDGGRTHPARGG